MSSRITEPPSIIDGQSPGDTIIGVRPASQEAYAEFARQESGIPPKGARDITPPPVPSEEPLPSPGVARAYVGKEIQRLRERAEAGRRDLAARFVFAANGSQISDPAVLEMRRNLAAEVEAFDAEADRLDHLDDLAARRWAYDHGAR